MHISRRQVVFQALRQVALETAACDLEPAPGQVLIETGYSCISAGTEIAKLTGRQTIQFPVCLGNRAIGRIAALGPKLERNDLAVGDLVFSHTPHASHVIGEGLVARLPAALDRPDTALLGMAMVSLIGVQRAAAEVGDVALVLGAGLVGNFAAQLLRGTASATLLLDPLEGRLEVARACAIQHAVNPSRADVAALVAELSHGRGADVILDCTGHPPTVAASLPYARRGGRVVLVGSPRGQFASDLTEFLNHFHLFRDHGDLTLVGAHEWRVPRQETPENKHSMKRNLDILAALAMDGRLQTQPLLSRVFPPGDCAAAYQLLIAQPAETLGVVFDWKG